MPTYSTDADVRGPCGSVLADEALRAVNAARATRSLDVERRRLEKQRIVLSMTLYGAGAEQVEIAAALGLRSHSSISVMLERIREEAMGRPPWRNATSRYG